MPRHGWSVKRSPWKHLSRHVMGFSVTLRQYPPGALPGASRRGPGVRGVKLSPLPRRRVVLIGAGQGCASPVPPFAGSYLTDEPGARPLTCQLFAQIRKGALMQTWRFACVLHARM